MAFCPLIFLKKKALISFPKTFNNKKYTRNERQHCMAPVVKLLVQQLLSGICQKVHNNEPWLKLSGSEKVLANTWYSFTQFIDLRHGLALASVQQLNQFDSNQ